MSWGKWGTWTGTPAEVEKPPDNVLSTRRYCPRDDRETLWTNERTGDTVLACTVCGITVGSKLEPHEIDRVVEYEAKPVRAVRRAYQVV